jgi:N-acetylmuramoyl-L-alanine amidase
MLTRTVLAAAISLLATAASAAPPVRTMYTEALAREQTVRAALAVEGVSPTTLQDARAVVSAYEAVVKQYPASGYSDNALWQAGRLALVTFERFGEPHDRNAGIRLLRKLAAVYPTSTLVKQVPDELARAGAAAPPAAVPVADAPKPPSAVVADAAPATMKVATIKEIQRAVLPDAVRITIELDGEVPFHDERITAPARVFVDLPGTRAAPPLVDQTLRFEGDADIVRQVRVGRHPGNLTRIVLDAVGVANYSVYPLYSPYRLVIDCVRAISARPTAAPTAATAVGAPAAPPTFPVTAASLSPARPPLTTGGLAVDSSPLPWASPDAAALITEASAPAVDVPAVVAAAPRRAEVPPAAPSAPPAPPASNLSGGFSIARQLGLGVSRIVIDAGHGGHDPGAQGKGVSEAELVLNVTLRLEKLLQKVPGIEVILTRRTDEFIPLPERTAIANREGADLFLSIHANASPNVQARGIETYFLDFANNLSAASVAARENAASGQAMGALPDFVKAIALNNKLDESKDFATHVQRALYERLKGTNKALKNLGVKQAPFVVLIGAAMPSVLVEISFVTNPQEAKLLKSNAYRQQIAESFFNAIRKYQASLKHVTTVAHK